MNRLGVVGTILMLVGVMVHPRVFAAGVDIAPGVVSPTDRTIARELTAAFDRAVLAVQQGDLDKLMLFYEKDYNYHGLNRSDVRRVWTEVFNHYGQIESKHVFTELKVVRSGSKTKAFVTCTGGLYGTEKASGKQITIDTWVGEVHFLVRDNDGWKILGNAGGALPEVPASSAPHHPLF